MYLPLLKNRNCTIDQPAAMTLMAAKVITMMMNSSVMEEDPVEEHHEAAEVVAAAMEAVEAVDKAEAEADRVLHILEVRHLSHLVLQTTIKVLGASQNQSGIMISRV